MMGIGLSISVGGAPPRILRSWSASDSASAATGLVTLAPWLSISCATTGRTTQTSTSTRVDGLGANAARARNVGSGWGLSVEMARTNFKTRSETLGSWTLGGNATNPETDALSDPAGNMAADRLAWTTDQASCAVGASLLAANEGVFSLWCQAYSGTTAIDIFASDAFAAYIANQIAIGASWSRVALYCNGSAPANKSINVGHGWRVGDAGSAWLGGAQLEYPASYPGSYIPTTTGSVARAADVLSVPVPADIAPGGFFDLDITLAPNYAAAEQAADHNLFYLDANNRIYLKQSDNKVYCVVGGTAIASAAIAQAREDAIRIQCSHKSGVGQVLTVSKNGTPVGATVTDATVKTAIALPAAAYLLGGGATGAEECADLRSIVVRRP